jgi:hypothetical protein
MVHTLDLITARKLAEKRKKANDYKEYCPALRNGAVDPSVDAWTAIAQLYEPNRVNPVALIRA